MTNLSQNTSTTWAESFSQYLIELLHAHTIVYRKLICCHLILNSQLKSQTTEMFTVWRCSDGTRADMGHRFMLSELNKTSPFSFFRVCARIYVCAVSLNTARLWLSAATKSNDVSHKPSMPGNSHKHKRWSVVNGNVTGNLCACITFHKYELSRHGIVSGVLPRLLITSDRYIMALEIFLPVSWIGSKLKNLV